MGANIHANQDIALRTASLSGNTELVRILVEAGAQVNADRSASLKYACDHGFYEIAKILLSHGASTEGAYTRAIGSGDLKMIMILGDSDEVILGQSIVDAYYSGNPEISDYLINLDKSPPEEYNVVLFWACRKGRLDIVKLMLSKGADINANGSQALRNSIVYGNIEVLEFLLDNGVDSHVYGDLSIRLSAIYED